jgi:hypothetical protein
VSRAIEIWLRKREGSGKARDALLRRQENPRTFLSRRCVAMGALNLGGDASRARVLSIAADLVQRNISLGPGCHYALYCIPFGHDKGHTAVHRLAAMNVALDPAKRKRLTARRRVCCGDASGLSSYVSGSMAYWDGLDMQRGRWL